MDGSADKFLLLQADPYDLVLGNYMLKYYNDALKLREIYHYYRYERG